MTTKKKTQPEIAPATKEQRSFAVAMAAFTEARAKIAALGEAFNDNENKLHRVKRELAAAVNAEKYQLADQLKSQRDALELAIAGGNEDGEKLAGIAREAYKEANAAWHREHPAEKEEVTVVRVTVTDPTPGSYRTASVTYTDSADTVQVSLNGLHFSSEAYHLGSWAEGNGFMYDRAEVTVQV